MSYKVTPMALYTATTCLTYTLYPTLVIIHWLPGRPLRAITQDRSELVLKDNSGSKRRLTHFSGLTYPLIIWTQSRVCGTYWRKVNQRNPQCQNIAELTNLIILEEWWCTNKDWKVFWNLFLIFNLYQILFWFENRLFFTM